LSKLKIILTLVAFFSIWASTAQEWQWLNPKPQGNDLNSAYSLDTTLNIAVGNSGTILRSVNKGLDPRAGWVF